MFPLRVEGVFGQGHTQRYGESFAQLWQRPAVGADQRHLGSVADRGQLELSEHRGARQEPRGGRPPQLGPLGHWSLLSLLLPLKRVWIRVRLIAVGGRASVGRQLLPEQSRGLTG